MPFKSRAQQRWMFATNPEMAKKWADKTKNFKKLPEKVKKKKKKVIKESFHMRPAYQALIEVSVRTSVVALNKRMALGNANKTAKAISGFQKWTGLNPTTNPANIKQTAVLGLFDNISEKMAKSPLHKKFYDAPRKFAQGSVGRRAMDYVRRDRFWGFNTKQGKKVWNMNRKELGALT